MEIGLLIKQLLASIVGIMKSFQFTLMGVTVDLWSIFIWSLFASFIISLINKFTE